MKGDAKAFREWGERLGRDGLSKRVISLVEDFNANPTYISAIILAGRLSAIAAACKFDDYWTEKIETGFDWERRALRREAHQADAALLD